MATAKKTKDSNFPEKGRVYDGAKLTKEQRNTPGVQYSYDKANITPADAELKSDVEVKPDENSDGNANTDTKI